MALSGNIFWKRRPEDSPEFCEQCALHTFIAHNNFADNTSVLVATDSCTEAIVKVA
jgi:hypothetical protein